MFDLHFHLPDKVEFRGRIDVHHIQEDRGSEVKLLPIFMTVRRKATMFNTTVPTTYNITLTDEEYFTLSIGDETDAEGNVTANDPLFANVSDATALTMVPTGDRSWNFLTSDDPGHLGTFQVTVTGGPINILVNVTVGAATATGAKVNLGVPALKSSLVAAAPTANSAPATP